MNETKAEANLKWYAMYTKPRHEFKAAQEFRAEGIEYYLPTVTLLKQWSDRKKKVTEPLFKGYIFIHCTQTERLKAVQCRSVVKVVSFEGKPSVIPDWEIENLKRLLDNTSKVEITDIPKIGSHVKVIAGPLQGLEGIVFENDNNERMIAITIELLKRSVVARLPIENVVEIDPSKRSVY